MASWRPCSRPSAWAPSCRRWWGRIHRARRAGVRTRSGQQAAGLWRSAAGLGVLALSAWYVHQSLSELRAHGGVATFVLRHVAVMLIASGLVCLPWERVRSGGRLISVEWFYLSMVHAVFTTAAAWVAGVYGAQGTTLVMSSVMAGFALWAALDLHLSKDDRQARAGRTRKPDQDGAATAQRRRLWASAIFAMVPLILPLLTDVGYLDGRLNKAVLKGLGLRVEDTTVRLKGEALATARLYEEVNGVGLSFCQDGDGAALVGPVTLMWHGMGKRSLVALGHAADNAKEDERMRFEADAAEVKLTSHGGRQCQDLDTELYFASGKAGYNAVQMAGLLEELTRALARRRGPAAEAPRWRLDRLVVRGHADPMPQGDFGNERLARRRAACAAVRLGEALFQQAGADDTLLVDWDGKGARSPVKQDCPLSAPKDSQVECHAVNRRVHVRLVFACVDGQGRASQDCAVHGAMAAASAASTAASSPAPSAAQQALLAPARAACDHDEAVDAAPAAHAAAR